MADTHNTIPDEGIDAEAAYRLVHDETMLDGNARLNLATFVTTWMDDFADKLYADMFDKNLINKDEYPQTAAIEERSWCIIADLWHSPNAANAIGTSTVGSSEHPMRDGHDLANYVDENTIGVVAILGVTYTGSYEPVVEI
ncbi:glutamate/tyrosine decarboxylase-like PLP-dependent enzyme [Leifsonia psychrotolerans]|uniref:glutamate decarboxylase n=1 Tax=Glaciibacter psychrotolerans TaxID=670054 RepID=A0A7Z0EHL6_9MICO|nr:glutamate/tyrosine decarboxylase-like PLP-dependent enzyme [Leifsonia psychrotolerans]